MSYKRSDLLQDFDVFPLVFPKNKSVDIHIKPTGSEPIFEKNTEYPLLICALEDGDPYHFPTTGNFKSITVKSDENGAFTINHTFPSEQEYHLIFLKEDGREKARFSVYCVDDDLCGRYPFMGDLHMHTYLSDGDQSPEVVCANYRKYGYDFIVISDHCRYYPSLQAIEAYKNADIEMNIVPGEEVHLPPVYGKTNDIHIVNFGGEYSVNALTEGAHLEEVGPDKKYRSFKGECPDIMSYDEFQSMIQALADKADLPDNVEKIPYTMCCWIFDEIRKANGLGIFAHPTWKRRAYHAPEPFLNYMLEHKPFDAFEVLGGERYYEHNGFQTVKYYETMAKGVRLPIVGSTDSHSSYESNKGAFIAETMVFAPENDKDELIKSIKDFYSVAVDTISEEFRLVGESRLVRYACFIINKYLPVHDELCYEEGRLMRQYVTGTDEEKEDAAKTLSFINGRMKKLREKYFAF